MTDGAPAGQGRASPSQAAVQKACTGVLLMHKSAGAVADGSPVAVCSTLAHSSLAKAGAAAVHVGLMLAWMTHLLEGSWPEVVVRLGPRGSQARGATAAAAAASWQMQGAVPCCCC